MVRFPTRFWALGLPLQLLGRLHPTESHRSVLLLHHLHVNVVACSLSSVNTFTSCYIFLVILFNSIRILPITIKCRKYSYIYAS